MYGFAYTDISTGEFQVTQASLNLILAELARLSPSEVVGPILKRDIKPFQIVPDEEVDLPKEFTLTVDHYEDGDLDEEVSDAISNEYGFTHLGFNFIVDGQEVSESRADKIKKGIHKRVLRGRIEPQDLGTDTASA